MKRLLPLLLGICSVAAYPQDGKEVWACQPIQSGGLKWDGDSWSAASLSDENFMLEFELKELSESQKSAILDAANSVLAFDFVFGDALDVKQDNQASLRANGRFQGLNCKEDSLDPDNVVVRCIGDVGGVQIVLHPRLGLAGKADLWGATYLARIDDWVDPYRPDIIASAYQCTKF